MISEVYLEECPYCGCMIEDPCEEPPPDYCERALYAVYGDPLKPIPKE
jgi:hypothetical protein